MIAILLKNAFKLFKQSRIIFAPKKSDVLIFDNNGLSQLSSILPHKDFTVLCVRGEEVNLCALILAVCSFSPKRVDLASNYIYWFVRLTKARFVVTFTDNSWRFQTVSEMCDVVTISFQNGWRSSLGSNTLVPNTHVVDHMFVAGKGVSDWVKKGLARNSYGLGLLTNNSIALSRNVKRRDNSVFYISSLRQHLFNDETNRFSSI